MSSGVSFDPTARRLKITYKNRVVSTTDGSLVELLPAINLNAKVLTFRDFVKDEAYIWTFQMAGILASDPPRWKGAESCSCSITAVPQERTDTVNLIAVPAGADLVVGHVRLKRTTAPANTWMNRPLNVLPVQNQWIPFSGAFSAMVEAEVGMGRMIHAYIKNGFLVMEAQQSVGSAMGGYIASFGDSGLTDPTDSIAKGGSILQRTTKGIPIFTRASKAYGLGERADITSFIATPAHFSRSGDSPCARNDTTNYTSVYSLDLAIRFGRRS